jgi:hypothetical protein
MNATRPDPIYVERQAGCDNCKGNCQCKLDCYETHIGGLCTGCQVVAAANYLQRLNSDEYVAHVGDADLLQFVTDAFARTVDIAVTLENSSACDKADRANGATLKHLTPITTKLADVPKGAA